jgi:16S rRNA (cytosine967-C5)-methyltransferase
MASRPADARSLALSILDSLDTGRRTLDALMEEMDRREHLDQRDRAFLNTLVYGVLRWRGRLDWHIGRISKVPLKKVDRRVLNILRLGLFQIQYLDRVPASAAVNTSVEMAKAVAAPWVVKFVNAVLRKMASSKGQIPGPAGGGRISVLSVEKSMPEWLVARWVRRFGEEETGALCDAFNAVPAITVRTNTLRTRREHLLRDLAPLADQLWPTPHSPDGVCLTGAKRPIGQMPAFEAGHFQVQDEAAQLVAYLTAPRPGETVLDACAGLGGKTGALAQLMENQGRILAVDVNETKLRRLTQEMKRLGIDMVETLRADLTREAPGGAPPGSFDRVLLDAPCSGLGVLGRNPDTKWSLSEKELTRYGRRQGALLDRVSAMVKPGGFLVYTVCSMEPEENEMVAADFRVRHPGFSLAPPPWSPELDQRFLCADGYFRSFPHRHGMDGFFGATFRRDG